MKKHFFEYYRPSEKKFDKLWKEALFVFDANVLLNLYRYPEKIRNELFKILNNLSDRLWIPYQFAFEYQKNRLSEIKTQNDSYENIIKEIDGTLNHIKKNLQNYARHPFLDVENISKEIGENLEKIKKQIQSKTVKHPDWFKNDTIRKKITKIFDGKIGDTYDETKLQKIYKEGKKRYEEDIPPGYKDKNKNGTNTKDNEKYGDLVGWFQIIDKAKKEKKSIIFITDDGKDDWWRIQDGIGIIGPKPKLVREIYDKSGVSFHMYRMDKFIELAKKHIEDLKDIDTKTIREVKAIRKSYEKKQPSTIFGWQERYAPHLSREISTTYPNYLYDNFMIKDKLEIGQVKTYSIGGENFEIEFISKSPDYLVGSYFTHVKLSVNGVIVELKERETKYIRPRIKICLLSLKKDYLHNTPIAEIGISKF